MWTPGFIDDAGQNVPIVDPDAGEFLLAQASLDYAYLRPGWRARLSKHRALLHDTLHPNAPRLNQLACLESGLTAPACWESRQNASD